jgi:hypothetical protein
MLRVDPPNLPPRWALTRHLDGDVVIWGYVGASPVTRKTQWPMLMYRRGFFDPEDAAVAAWAAWCRMGGDPQAEPAADLHSA